MRVVTFYSYKGGVGRTQALVNVAAGLVREGKRVLLVDFDLEAPGLDAVRGLRFESGPGLVELIRDYLDAGVAPRIEKYARPAQFIDLTKADSEGRPGRSKLGAVFVLPSGDRRDESAYKRRLSGIDFVDLYAHRSGYLLFEDLRCQWRDTLKVDYVLIDSRTGHTDIGGICVRQLPDHVVLMFYPNDQNLQGIASVAEEARAEPRTPEIDAVMSRVPYLDDYEQHLFEFEVKARRRLRVPRMYRVHSYESIHIVRDEIFLANRRLDRTRLSKEYRRLVGAIVARNVDDRDSVRALLEAGAVKVRNVVGRDRIEDWCESVRRRYRGDDEVLDPLALALRRMGSDALEQEVRTDLARIRVTGAPARDLVRAQELEATDCSEAASLAARALGEGDKLALSKRLEAFLVLCRLDSPRADGAADILCGLPVSAEWADEHWELLTRSRGGLRVARAAYERAGYEPWFGPGRQTDGMSGESVPVARSPSQSERLGIAVAALGPPTQAMVEYIDERVRENMVLRTRSIDSLPCAPFRSAAEFAAWIREVDREGFPVIDGPYEVRERSGLRNDHSDFEFEGDPEYAAIDMCLEFTCGIRPDSPFDTRCMAAIGCALSGDTKLAKQTLEMIRVRRMTDAQKERSEPWVFNHWRMLTRPLSELERDLAEVVSHASSEFVQNNGRERLHLRPPFLGDKSSRPPVR